MTDGAKGEIVLEIDRNETAGVQLTLARVRAESVQLTLRVDGPHGVHGFLAINGDDGEIVEFHQAGDEWAVHGPRLTAELMIDSDFGYVEEGRA